MKSTRGEPWPVSRGAPELHRLALLQQLRDRSCPVLLAGPTGASLNASLCCVDAGRDSLSFQVEAGDPQLEALVEANEATALSYLEAQVLQFDLVDLVLVRNPIVSVLRARLPRQVHRFTRSEAPSLLDFQPGAPCVLLSHPAHPEMALTLRIIDLSLAGAVLMLPEHLPVLTLGVPIGGVQLALDAETRMVLSLRLLHASSKVSGAPGLLLGCEWLGLTRIDARRLQQYIDQTQTRQHTLARG
jgi:hypothetical protein